MYIVNNKKTNVHDGSTKGGIYEKNVFKTAGGSAVEQSRSRPAPRPPRPNIYRAAARSRDAAVCRHEFTIVYTGKHRQHSFLSQSRFCAVGGGYDGYLISVRFQQVHSAVRQRARRLLRQHAVV